MVRGPVATLPRAALFVTSTSPEVSIDGSAMGHQEVAVVAALSRPQARSKGPADRTLSWAVCLALAMATALGMIGWLALRLAPFVGISGPLLKR